MSSLSTTQFLKDILWEHKYGFSSAICLMIIIGIIPCCSAVILGVFVDILNEESNITFWQWFYLALFWLIIGNGIWRLYDYIFLSLMSAVTTKSIYRYFSTLQRYNSLFFKKYTIGKINYNIMDVSRAIDQVFSHFNERIVQEISTILCSLIMIFYYDLYLGCIILFLLLCIMITAYVFSKYIKHLSFIFYEQRSNVSAIISDILLNILHVKNLFQFKKERSYVKDASQVLAKKDRNMQMMMLYSHTTQSIITIVGLTFSYYYLYQMKIHHLASVGIIIALFYLVQEIINSVWEITESLADLFEELGALNQVLKFINNQYVCHLDKASNIKPFVNGDIHLNKIGFGYDNNNSIFNQFSLSVKQGEKVGVVGISGAGKSTLSSLLNRSYDVLSGEITIAKQNITNIDLHDLRKNIGIISQQLILFNRSIRDNIAYGSNEDLQDQNIILAAKQAGIHDFIENLPEKYDTLCTNTSFSGGQKQRILIARLLCIKCKILICDEHTSGLDNFTNKVLQNVFNKVMHDKTVIYITHNLSLLKNVDRVIVLEYGKIIQNGKHDDLIKQDGIYKKLWSLN
ncbi:MAG: ABC transporter ATP-binding protein [Pseudomonadota bacterium]